MNEEKDQKPEGHEQDFSEFAKQERPRPEKMDGGGGSAFMRGCGILLGVAVLAFFFILGTCFLG